MGKETLQRLGIEGVTKSRSGWRRRHGLAFAYTVYDSELMCAVICQNGEAKALDLEGHTMSNPKRPVSVECKKYSSPVARRRRVPQVPCHRLEQHFEGHRGEGWRLAEEFMWVTYHPFSQKKWSDLLSVSFMKQCVEEHKSLLDGETTYDDLLARVAAPDVGHGRGTAAGWHPFVEG